MEFSKFKAVDDHQEWNSDICLDAEETQVFFNTFDTVEDEFHQLVFSLPEKPTKSTATASTADPTSATASLKRKASYPAASISKFQKNQPGLGPMIPNVFRN